MRKHEHHGADNEVIRKHLSQKHHSADNEVRRTNITTYIDPTHIGKKTWHDISVMKISLDMMAK